MNISTKLQEFRNKKNLTQKELAEKVGVSTGVVAEWESGESEPTIEELLAISGALDVSVDALIKESSEDIKLQSVDVKIKKSRKSGKWILIGFAFFILLSVACLLLFFFMPKEGPKEEKIPFSTDVEAIAVVEKSMVKIVCYNYFSEEVASGSGFVAFDEKTVVTNFHVIEDACLLKISTSEDIVYTVQDVVAYSETADIAILHIEKDTGLMPLTLGNPDIVKKGEKVTAIGSPLGLKNTVSQGVLSGRVVGDSVDSLQFTAPISSGSSGGALFNESGEVIGVTYAAYIDGQNMNLAIPINLVKRLIEEKGSLIPLTSIYSKKHPYFPRLSGYQNVPKVTLEDLQSNPRAYDGKTIRIEVYVSSEYEQVSSGIGLLSDGQYYFGGNEDSVSGDYRYDEARYSFEKYNKSIPILKIYAREPNYVYERNSISVGDRIMVIGEFEYHEKGDVAYVQPEVPGYFPEETVYWQLSTAKLNVKVVYES